MTVIASAQSPEVFGGLHLALLGLTVLLGVVVVWGVRHVRGTHTEISITTIAGWVLLVSTLIRMVWFLLPENWHIDHSLPLHYSDALRVIAAIALIRRSRWSIAITYYWGLTLNPQALVTPHPNMLVGPSVEFVLYWWLHILVQLAPLALIWGSGYRPQWRDFSIAYGVALTWAALAMTVNALIGTNYAFLNQLPDGRSLMDFLGPWPIYVLWVAVLVALVWALMTWPWTPRSAKAKRDTDHTPAV